MSLPIYGQQSSIPTITQDQTISPQTENGIHRIIYDNIEKLKELVGQKHLTLDSDNPYAKFHTSLNSFHSPGLANQRNNGFNIQAINHNSFKLDPKMTGLDFENQTFSSKEEYQYQRQKYSVYLFSDSNGVPLDFPVGVKDFSHIATHNWRAIGSNNDLENGTTKMFLKGHLSAPDIPTYQELAYDQIYLTNNPTHIDEQVPMVGFILDHNLDHTSPKYYVFGWNRNMELGIYKFTLSDGFKCLKRYLLNMNLLYCDWGRSVYRNWYGSGASSPDRELFSFFRKPRRAMHYGKNLQTYSSYIDGVRSYLTGYYFFDEDHTNHDVYTDDIYHETSFASNLNDPFRMGLFFSPNLGFEIHNLQYGYQYEGF